MALKYIGEEGILFLIFLGIIIGLIILVTIFERFFPKNKLSKKLEKFAEWIKDNVRVP